METLNQIVSNIKTLATSHVQLRTFYYGFPADLSSSGLVQYPALLLTFTGGQHAPHGTKYNFTFTALDVLLPDRSNEPEVMSDLCLVATDIIAQLRHHDYDWYIEGSTPGAATDTPLLPWYEITPNYTAAVSFDLSFSLKTPSDRCRIPWVTSAPQANSGVGTQVTIRDASTGATIATVPCGTYYEVLQFSGIDGGSPSTTYSNSIVAGIP